MRLSVRTERGYRLGISGAHDGLATIVGAAPRITRLDVRRATLEDVYFARTQRRRPHPASRQRPASAEAGMSALATVQAIVARDLSRAFRQKSRLLGGLARPFMWLLLVGTGYNAIARVEGAASYQAFVFPGLVVMAALFGAHADGDLHGLRPRVRHAAPDAREPRRRPDAARRPRDCRDGRRRPCRAASCSLCAPLLVTMTAAQLVGAAAALVLAAAVSSVLGLLVAAPLRSVENFAGMINVVLFPLLFLSGALYPTASMPAGLRVLARVNPVSYAVDLMRGALGQPMEFGASLSLCRARPQRHDRICHGVDPLRSRTPDVAAQHEGGWVAGTLGQLRR